MTARARLGAHDFGPTRLAQAQPLRLLAGSAQHGASFRLDPFLGAPAFSLRSLGLEGVVN